MVKVKSSQVKPKLSNEGKIKDGEVDLEGGEAEIEGGDGIRGWGREIEGVEGINESRGW